MSNDPPPTDVTDIPAPPGSLEDALAVAVGYHQSSRLVEAAAQYGKILAADTSNVAALHLLGVVHHQLGDSERATELIGQAARLEPRNAIIQASLAEACLVSGRHNQAAECARAALEMGYDHPVPRCVLGRALQNLGEPEQAGSHFREALRLCPDFAPAHTNLGNLLWESGDGDQALAHFRWAVELEPDLVTARANLGRALLNLERADEALHHLEKAVRLKPDQADLCDNMGSALALLGRFREARDAFLEAMRLDPSLAAAHHHCGLVLVQLGQIADAERVMSRCIKLESGNPTFWELLAEIRSTLEMFDAAIPCWERVLALAPDVGARPHLALGLALQEENRLDEAEAQYRIASAIEPGSASPLFGLGLVHQDRGEFAEAEAAFRLAIRLEPTFPLAHSRLANLLGGKLPEADLEGLKARIDDPATDEEPRTRLIFAHGHVLDSRGEFKSAADCFRRANVRQLAAASGHREFRPAVYQQFIDTLIRIFDRNFFTRSGGAGLATRKPVFVIGLPRSGTTLVEQVLASHPRIVGAGELELCRRTVESLPALLNSSASPAECAALLDRATIGRLAESYLDRLQTLVREPADRIVDKMLDNSYHLGILLAMFPRAHVIHCRRDLRDTALSCWMADFRSLNWANDPVHIAIRFRAHLQLMDHWRTTLPTSIHEVEYERFVADPERESRSLIGALGLDWDPGCLDFHRTKRPVRTSSFAQVRQPLYRRSVGRWRCYEGEIADLLAAVADLSPG
jgi:tetratricopeptide (TPR) repeat protein